jgi:hypothetical protein
VIPQPGTPFTDLRSARGGATDPQVMVHNNCWACDQRFTQSVLDEGYARHELHWQCDACEVSWTAVGVYPLNGTA